MTKKYHFLPLLLTLTIVLFALAACNTEPAGSEGLEYTSNEDGTCYVSGLGDCQDSDVVIPAKSPDGDRVTEIGRKAFAECETVKSITIPASVNTIGREAFYHCTSLVSVLIPEGVNKIGFEAFRSCEKLEQLVIPEGVTEITWLCFEQCSSLKTISIPASVEKIDPSAFANCNNLESFIVASGNPVYHSAGNCIIKTSTRILIRGCKTSILPTDGTVTYIGANAFSYCNTLTDLAIPDCVQGFGNDAFNYCTSLTSVTVPDGVTKLSEKNFHHCDSMVTLTLPGSITQIEPGALGECISLTEIRFNGTMEQWWNIQFGEDWCPFSGDFIVKCTDGNT